MRVRNGLDASVFMCFSHLRWNFVFQRPHHIFSRIEKEATVYFLEEPIYDGDAAAPRIDVTTPLEHVTVVTPVLPQGASTGLALEAQRLILSDLLARHAGAPIVFWYYTPMALLFSAHHPCDLCVYDCMDELRAFRGASEQLEPLEDALLRRADVVFTGGRSLFEAKRRLHPNVHLFPSSVDAGHFAAARPGAAGGPLADPPDQRAIPRPRVGFFGVLDERLDTDLVADLARRRADLQFVMLGPVAKIDPADLPQADNIHWLGIKRYADLPAYMAHWDAGFMPFARNDATRFISPTKTPEFLAAGLPVVSTPIRDVVSPYGDENLVAIAATAEAFAAALDRVLAEPRAVRQARADAFLAGLSWDRTWAEMRRRLLSVQPLTDAADGFLETPVGSPAVPIGS